MRLSFPWHGQVQIGARELLGKHNDLAYVQLQMASHAANGFENGHGRPTTSWLRMNCFEEPRWWKRANHVFTFREGCGEAFANLRTSLRRREREFRIAVADIRLAVNSMQEPLPQIAFEMKKKIGDGIFVIRPAVPHLLIRQLIDTAIDRIFGELHSLYRCGKEQMGYLVSHEGTS